MPLCGVEYYLPAYSTAGGSPLRYAREMLQRAELSLPSCYILEDACREFERDWKTLPNLSNLREMIVKHFQRWEASRFSRAFIVRCSVDTDTPAPSAIVLSDGWRGRA